MKTLSCVQLLATPWTAAYQASPSMWFSRQEYWSGMPLPSPHHLPTLLHFQFNWWYGIVWDFPGGSDCKETDCKAGDPGLITELGRSPEVGNSNSLQYSCLENSVDRRAWRATVHRVTKSQLDTTERLTLSGCSLFIEPFKSSLGDSNVHQNLEIHCLKGYEQK